MSSLLLSVLVVATLSALAALGPALRRWSARAGQAILSHSPCALRRAVQRRAQARGALRTVRPAHTDSVERVLSLAELRRGG